jgi:hypothetical protein
MDYRIVVVEGMIPQKMLLIKKLFELRLTSAFDGRNVFPTLHDASRFVEGKAELLLADESVAHEIVDLIGARNVYVIEKENGKVVRDIHRGHVIVFDNYEEKPQPYSQEQYENAMKWRDSLSELDRSYFDILQAQPACAYAVAI